MNEADLQEIERYYQQLSTLIRLHGAEHLGRAYVIVRLARMEVTGPLDYSDLQRILRGVVDHRTWYPAWRAEAQAAETEAERMAAEGRSVSAADLFHRASACYHWGQYLARVGSDEKAEGRLGRVRCYRRAVELMDAEIEPLSIPYADTELARLPPSGGRRTARASSWSTGPTRSRRSITTGLASSFGEGSRC